MVRRQNLLRCRVESVENTTQIVHCTHSGPRAPAPAMVLKNHNSFQTGCISKLATKMD
jgi:hypothetical protein